MRIIMSSTTDRDSDIALITRAVLKLARRMRTDTPSGTLTPGMVGLLATLFREGPMSGVALAQEEGLKPQSLTRLLAAMEEKDMIARTPDPEDRRNRIISITVRGRQSLRWAMQQRRRWLAEAVADRLSDEERATLVEAAELMLRLAL
jgi:DNA-binding MarR family transcriptional regulator